MTTETGRAAAARNVEAASHLHPDAIRDPAAIARILLRARDERTQLSLGLSRRIEPQLAVFEAIGADLFTLSVANLALESGDTAFLSFSRGAETYFFASSLVRRTRHRAELT